MRTTTIRLVPGTPRHCSRCGTMSLLPLYAHATDPTSAQLVTYKCFTCREDNDR